MNKVLYIWLASLFLSVWATQRLPIWMNDGKQIGLMVTTTTTAPPIVYRGSAIAYTKLNPAVVSVTNSDASVQEGDLMIVVLNYETATAVTNSSGYASHGHVTDPVKDPTPNPWLFSKIATASDTTNVSTFHGATASRTMLATLYAYDGASGISTITSNACNTGTNVFLQPIYPVTNSWIVLTGLSEGITNYTTYRVETNDPSWSIRRKEYNISTRNMDLLFVDGARLYSTGTGTGEVKWLPATGDSSSWMFSIVPE